MGGGSALNLNHMTWPFVSAGSLKQYMCIQTLPTITPYSLNSALISGFATVGLSQC